MGHPEIQDACVELVWKGALPPPGNSTAVVCVV